MEKTLFQEFSATPDSAWEQQIKKELKGADANDKLFWRAPDLPDNGFRIQPYYRKPVSAPAPIPGIDPGHRCAYRLSWSLDEGSDWRTAAGEAKQRDATGTDCYGSADALKRLDEEAVDQPELAIRLFENTGTLLSGTVCPAFSDPFLLPSLLPSLTGRKACSWDAKDWDHLASDWRGPSGPSPASASCYLDAANLHASGLDILNELAYTWSAAAGLLEEMQQRKVQPEALMGRLIFRVACGPNFFLELAKLRTLRIGWNIIGQTVYDTKALFPQPEILATACTWNLARRDAHNNLLRLTTEAAAAVLGGADTLSLPRFDQFNAPDNAFARRLSENLALLLDKEAHLSRVSDPAAGSWYVEKLTDELGQAAWTRFQRIAAGGGFHASVQRGELQQAITEGRARRLSAFRQPGQNWIGVTRYQPSGFTTEEVPHADRLWDPETEWTNTQATQTLSKR